MASRTAVRDLVQIGPPSEHDFFRLVYHYAVEHAPAHLPKMQNYVALYGFLRTTCFVVVLYFWFLFVKFLSGAFAFGQLLIALIVLGIVAYILFMAFMKFYRRFSLEALMALSAVLPEPEA